MDGKEREKWLLSVDEDAAFKLPMQDWYDRIRLKRQILAEAHLNEVGYCGGESKIEVPLKEKFGGFRENKFYLPWRH
jgi:hypothetical protein